MSPPPRCHLFGSPGPSQGCVAIPGKWKVWKYQNYLRIMRMWKKKVERLCTFANVDNVDNVDNGWMSWIQELQRELLAPSVCSPCPSQGCLHLPGFEIAGVDSTWFGLKFQGLLNQKFTLPAVEDAVLDVRQKGEVTWSQAVPASAITGCQDCNQKSGAMCPRKPGHGLRLMFIFNIWLAMAEHFHCSSSNLTLQCTS